MNISELRERIKNNNPDGSIAKIVFGGDANDSRKLFKSNRAVLKYMSRLIVLWFHYIYFSYRKKLDPLAGEERKRVLAAMDRSRVLRGFEKLITKMALRSFKDEDGSSAMPRLLPERVEAFAAKFAEA